MIQFVQLFQAAGGTLVQHGVGVKRGDAGTTMTIQHAQQTTAHGSRLGITVIKKAAGIIKTKANVRQETATGNLMVIVQSHHAGIIENKLLVIAQQIV